MTSNTSAQNALLVAFTGALEERGGTVVSQGIPIKTGNELLKLLEGVQKPKEVAVIRYKAHQSGNSGTAGGNGKADEAAIQAAVGGTINL